MPEAQNYESNGIRSTAAASPAVALDAPGPLSAATEVVIFPEEWSEEDRECCPSGIVDTEGKCCFSDKGNVPTVDTEGKCCTAGYVDACGVCGGDGKFLDREGTCCKVLHPVAACVVP